MAKGIFVSTNLKGKPLSFVSSVDLENGMLIEMGDIVSEKDQIYNAVAPTGTKAVYVIGDPAWSYDTSSVINQNEDEYVIKAGKVFRAYPLLATPGDRKDRFTVADYGINNGTTIAVGNYIGLTSGSYLPNNAGSSEPSTAFIGKVVKVNTQGFTYWVGQSVDTRVKLVTIEVEKNG
jgi:hypothetical protein